MAFLAIMCCRSTACLEESPINVVGCTREDCAGFAADAYARINGMGGGLHHLLRRWTERLQQYCGGVCREVAGGGDQRRAGG